MAKANSDDTTNNMTTGVTPNRTDTAARGIDDGRFAANDVRLSARLWLFVAALTGLAFWWIPLGWQKIEPLEMTADYRIPYRLGNDYWQYRRTSRDVCFGETTLLVGDSVFWGHYVGSQETLSHYLNVAYGGDRFANLGVDGIHPVALFGLIDCYGDAIRDKRVMVNCNLLWMSSPRHDLSSDKETPFNHPGLIPQFTVNIPCYRATASERLGRVVDRHFRFLGWAEHIRIAYLGSDDLATWTLAHPYENPFSQVTLALPSADEPPTPEPDAGPWFEKGLRQVNPEWVSLDQSLQWRFFRKTIQRLRHRGNRVFVIVGPLNEHMLSDPSRAMYNARKHAVALWLEQQGILYIDPDVLPSHTYADLSHPTAEGYALLADRLGADVAFRQFLSE